MNNRKLIVAVFLAVLLSSAVVFLCGESANAETESNSDGLDFHKTPDGLYGYSVERNGQVKKGGNWIENYTIRNNQSTINYTVHVANGLYSLKNVEASQIVLDASDVSGMVILGDELDDSLKVIYFTGQDWSVEVSGEDLPTIMTDCKKIVFEKDHADSFEVWSYLSKGKEVHIGSKTKLFVNWNGGKSDFRLSVNEKSKGKPVIFLEGSESEIILPFELYAGFEIKNEKQLVKNNKKALEELNKTGSCLSFQRTEQDYTEVNKTYYYTGDLGVNEVTIPALTEEYKLSGKCFSGMSLDSVEFQDGATRIDESVFYGCQIKSINIPNTIVSIGANAFKDSSLGKIEFEPSGVEELQIGDAAFQNTPLKSIIFPARVSVVYGQALMGCEELTSITFEKASNYKLEEFELQLESCISLSTLSMPIPSKSGFPDIPPVDSLSYTILESGGGIIEENGIRYYQRDGKLSLVNVSNDVAESVIIRDGVEKIPGSIFYKKGVKSIQIPASVESIGRSAFANSSLETLTFVGNSKLTQIYDQAFYGTKVSEVTLPSTLTSIGEKAFAFCPNLLKMKVNNGGSVSIGDSAFEGCGKLTEVEICTGLRIGSSAFMGTALKSFTISSNTVKIGASAFAGTGLTSITIPSSVTEIGFNDSSSVFPSSLETVEFQPGNTKYHLEGGCIYEIINGGYKLAFVGYGVDELKVIDGTLSMYKGIFKGHTSLKTVIFPEGFVGSEFVTDKGYTGIDHAAFQGCSSLTSVNASKASFTGIDSMAFAGTFLKSITFPEALEMIGGKAFYNCSELEGLNLAGTKLKTVGLDAFRGCSALVEVSLPDTLESLPGFVDSFKLNKITIDERNSVMKSVDNVMVISSDNKLEMVVQNVKSKAVTIPKYVTGVNASAFNNVTLDAVYVEEGNTALRSIAENKVLMSGQEVILIVNTATEITLSDEAVSMASNVLGNATSLTTLVWGDESRTAPISLGGGTSGLEEMALITKGDVTFGSIAFNNLSKIKIECAKLEFEKGGVISSSTDYAIGIKATTIVGDSFIKGDVASITISGDATTDLDLGGLLHAGQPISEVKENDEGENEIVTIGYMGVYDDISITIGEESKGTIGALTGKALTVKNGDRTVPVNILSIMKSVDVDGKITFEFVFMIDDPDLTVYDVDAKVGDENLKVRGNGFVVTIGSDDVTVSLTEKVSSTKYEVTFDPTGGKLPSEETVLTIGDGRTISVLQLSSMEPSRDGYAFKGWYMDKALFTDYNNARITKDTTLFARWEPINGPVVTIDESYGRVTATYSDGRLFYNGEKVESGTTLTLKFRNGSGIELLGWTVVSNGEKKTEGPTDLNLVVYGSIYVMPTMRVFSESNSLINITDLPTPEWENVTTVWQNQYDVDTSMSVWTGMPSIPLIVGDYVYVRAANDLLKLDIYTGEVVKKITTDNTTSKAYYHYLGYGGELIIDYNTQKAYDLDLNEGEGAVKTLPKEFTAVYYDNGNYYGLCEGKLWKFDAECKLVDGGWSGGVDVKWHGIYGTTSTPVFDNGWVYFVEVDGDSRKIGAVNLETGKKAEITLEEMNGYLCDDGWLTMYEYKGVKYLFMTGYVGGLFDTGSDGDSIVSCIGLKNDGSFDEGSERWMKFRASAAASAFVVVDGRGYINVSQQSTEANKDVGTAGGAFYVVDVHKFLDTPQDLWTNHPNEVDVDLTYDIQSVSGMEGEYGGWLIYADKSIRTHGSIVVSTAYKAETGNVYIYLLPYTASEQALYTFCDYEGKISGTGYLKSSPVGENYGSQAVRVGPNGELIWYTDSGTLWCVRGVSVMPYKFLIQDADGATWVETMGSSMRGALISALKSHYGTGQGIVTDNGGIICVKGIPLSVYFQDNISWVSIDIDSSSYNGYRTFFVSSTILTETDGWLNDGLDNIYHVKEGQKTEYTLLEILERGPTEDYYSKIKYVTAKIDTNGGTLKNSSDIVVSPGETITLPGVPSKKGYDFIGWEINGVIYRGGKAVLLETDVVVKAKWKWADESTQVAGVTITSKDQGFENEPVSGRWVNFLAAGYGESAKDAYRLMNAKNNEFTNESDVAPRTLFIYFEQLGTQDGDAVTGRLFTSDGTQIHQEVLNQNTKMWYITLSDVENCGGKVLKDYYKLGGTYTMAIYVNGQMACSADITVTDGDVSGVIHKGSSLTMSEGENVNLTPSFFINKDGEYFVGNVAQTGVVWSSSNPSVAEVNRTTGKLTGVSAGTTVVTVTTDDGGYVAYCYVTVSQTPVTQVVITSDDAPLYVGKGIRLDEDHGNVTATVSWSSSAPNIAMVDSEGNVTGVSAGTAVITVTVTDALGNTKSANHVVTVLANLVKTIKVQSTMSLQVGGSGILTATVEPTGADNTAVVWSSSNPSIASVSNGVVMAVAPGTATITVTAADGSGVSATCVVTVSKVPVRSVTLNSESLTLNIGGSSILTATVSPSNVQDSSVVWSSSNSAVVTVVNGVVTAVSPGNAIITVSTVDGGKTATCHVTVKGTIAGIRLSETTVSLTKGETMTLEYTLLPEGTGGYSVTWSTGNTSVATVYGGKITAVAPGTTTITATVGGTQLSAVCTVTVVGVPTEIDTSTEEKEDGSVTTTVTEEIEVGGGTSVDKVTETTTSKDGSTTSTVTKYTVGTEGSKVSTTVTITSDDNGSQMVAESFVPSSVSNGVRTVSPADMRVALEQMGIADAVTGEDVSSTVTVNVSTGADVSDVKATIPSESVSNLTGTGMTLVTDIGSLDFSGDVFGTIGKMEGNANVSISKVTGSAVPPVLEGKVGVAVFDVSLNVGGRSVHQLGGTVTMSLPYTLDVGQSVLGVKVYYIDDNGNMTVCQSRYDVATQTVSVPTDHFSTFSIVYEEPESASVSDDGDDDNSLIFACIGVMGAVIAVLAVMVAVMYSKVCMKRV